MRRARPPTAARPQDPSLTTLRYCVEPSSWLPSRDIAPLTPREIEAFLSDSKKKKGDLFEAYSVAKDPVEWNRQRADAQAEWEEMQAQLANEEDQLASDGDQPKGEGKKRKRPAQADKAGKGADKKKAPKAKKVSDSLPTSRARRG